MTNPPKKADLDRTVLLTATVDDSNGWWNGLVKDNVHDTGEERLRLERYTPRNTRKHVWRVRPDFWDAERAAVGRFDRRGGRSPPDNLPIDDYLTPLEYTCIRKDDVRWTAIVRIDSPNGGERTRLYHWRPGNGSTKQKWTVGRHWSTLERLATQLLHQ